MSAGLLAVLPTFCLAVATAAQAPTPRAPSSDTLRERLEDKLARPFLHVGRWHTDLEVAKREAARRGVPILAHFTRSFIPCGMSIGCERDVLSSAEFAELARGVELYCHVTAHVDAEADRLLFAAGGSGWPHHAVFDATGRVLASHPSHREKSVDELAQLIERAREFQRVEAETERTIADAYRRRLDAGLAAGALGLAEARVLFARVGELSAEERAHYDGRLVDLEVTELAARHDRFDESTHAVVGEQLYTMWRMGKRPVARNAVRDFWGGVLAYLEARAKRSDDGLLGERDRAVYAEGLAELEKRFGDHRGYARYLDERRSTFERIGAVPSESGAGR